MYREKEGHIPVVIRPAQPAIVKWIPVEEYKRMVLETSAKSFNQYSLTLDALETRKEGLTPLRVSRLTKRSPSTEKKYLERLKRARVIDEDNGLYSVNERTNKELKSIFGVEAILLSAEFMTDEEKEIEYNIINEIENQ